MYQHVFNNNTKEITNKFYSYPGQVSWMRKRDLHILTTNTHTYTGDQRFSVHHPTDSDDWDLRIEYVQPNDAGLYECQVNTEPKINLAVSLEVHGECSTSSNVPLPPIFWDFHKVD